MRILARGKWEDSHLDYWRSPESYRLSVRAWQTLERLDELYFVRPRSPRLVLNYVREMGFAEVGRKIRSRLQEQTRNAKFLSCGVGTVLEAPCDGDLSLGDWVAFVAPAHPECAERIVLPRGLMTPVQATDVPTSLTSGTENGLLSHLRRPRSDLPADVASIRGWSPFADSPLDIPAVSEIVEFLAALALDADWEQAEKLPIPTPSRVSEREGDPSPGGDDRPTAVLFGYGNYAKTTALAHARADIHLQAIHEIDPTQIPSHSDGIRWDTAPSPDAEEDYDAFLIAGYHVTHAPLAVEALRRGAVAVIEKPIATTESQLDALVDEMERSNGRVYCCFQRRHSPFNELARRDLGVALGDPISYHCIAYEVPLPELHWYRWPSSGSRLVSNGCHWIDHFLFLNGFAEATEVDLFRARDGTFNCSLELANGAVFSMALTHRGSERLGVRDHVELRVNDVAVTIENNSTYVAESSIKLLRRRRIARAESYRRMYSAIAKAIREGGPGDSIHSVRCSTGTVLALERRLATAAASDL